MGKVKGNFRGQGKAGHLHPVPHSVPGMEKALCCQEAENGEGDTSQNVANLPGLHQLPEDRGGILVYHQHPIHSVGFHQGPEQKAAGVVDDHAGYGDPFQAEAAQQTVPQGPFPPFCGS